MRHALHAAWVCADLVPASLPSLPSSPCSLWSRFFCLSVYITMYLNDHQRDAFYKLLGMNTDTFDRHVIIETNKTTERIFPEVGAASWAGGPQQRGGVPWWCWLLSVKGRSGEEGGVCTGPALTADFHALSLPP